MKKLLERWHSFRINIHRQIIDDLTFDYLTASSGRINSAESSVMDRIVEALSLWKFITQEIFWSCDETVAEQEKWEKRHELLSGLLSSGDFDDNQLARALIMLESMPTIAFRKIIWGYNIDFMSPESFLRRLSLAQIAAIVNNYQDFWQTGIVPQAFNKRHWFESKYSREDILSCEFEEGKRYLNAGAMSYNLLGWDFGFNAYPNGIDDDTKVVEVSPLRFLSVKNHADDFIVNKEFGIYFWLYKKARSNYAFFPGKTVKLKTHICPGFWYTIFIHLMFWIVSPICGAVVIANTTTGLSASIHWFFRILLGISAAFTPVWVLLAGIRYFINDVAVFSKITSFVDKHKKAVKIITQLFIILCGYLTEVLLVIASYRLLAAHIAPVWSGLVILLGLLYSARIIAWKSEENRDKCQRLKKSLRISSRLLAVALASKLVLTYSSLLAMIAEDIVRYVIIGLRSVIEFFVTAGPISLILFVPILAAVGVWYLSSLTEEKQEKIFKLAEKIMIGSVFGLWSSLIILTLISMDGSGRFLSLPLVILAAVAIAVLPELIIMRNIRPEARKADRLAREVAWEYYIGVRLNRKVILKNKWLSSLSEGTRRHKLTEAVELFHNIFHSFSENADLFYVWISNFDQSDLNRIKVAKGKLCHLRFNRSQVLAEKIFVKMISGHKFSRAKKMVEFDDDIQKSKEAVNKVRLEKIGKVAYIIFYPFVLIYKLLDLFVDLLVKLTELIKTLYRLYELFNKRCPYVAPQRKLEI